MSSDDVKLEILAEHYKDSFEILQSKINQRERLFFYVLCILIIMLFQLYAPQIALKVAEELISSRLNINTKINFSFIESIIWFSLLATSLKYFQSVVFIERQYNYISRLEEQISKEYEGQAFTREGLTYLVNYPCFLNWASLLYTIFSPVLLVVIATSKIIYELQATDSKSVLFWFNATMFLLILISTLLYLVAIHCKRQESPKTK